MISIFPFDFCDLESVISKRDVAILTNVDDTSAKVVDCIENVEIDLHCEIESDEFDVDGATGRDVGVVSEMPDSCCGPGLGIRSDFGGTCAPGPFAGSSTSCGRGGGALEGVRGMEVGLEVFLGCLRALSDVLGARES